MKITRLSAGIVLSCLIVSIAYGLIPRDTYEGIEKVPEPKSFLRIGCDKLYAENVDFILNGLKRVTVNPPSEENIKEYEAFMQATKMYTDLGFKIYHFEVTLTADIRDVLRKPLTKYSRCYTKRAANAAIDFQSVGPTPELLKPCEMAYAVHVQEALNELRGMAPADELKKFEDYMINLKTYQDLDFQIKEFEKKTNNVLQARLRMPIQKYNTCRDSLIRIGDAGPIFPR